MSEHDIPDLSIVDGPTHKLLSRITRRSSDRTIKIIAVGAAVICWVPLAVLSIAAGTAWGDRVTITFFSDLPAYARFLIAVPVMIFTESIIGPRLSAVAAHFMRSGRIAPEDREKYVAAIEEAIRLRDSKWGIAGVIVLAYALTISGRIIFTPSVSHWLRETGTGTGFPPAMYWYALVSVPIFQFLLIRWLMRLAVWTRFLYRISKLKLKLQPTHPDRAGGIAFIGDNQRLFAFVVFALGVVAGALSANEILYQGRPIETIHVPAVILACLFSLIVQLPCLFFFSMLRKTKIRGLFQYGDLALKYTSDFDRKWVRGKDDKGEEILGTGDIQSLADLGNSFLIINEMKLLPVTLRGALLIVAAFLIPILPVYLTVMPLREILTTLLKLLG